MSRLRKISFMLIFFVIAFLPVPILNFNIKKIHAENYNICLEIF